MLVAHVFDLHGLERAVGQRLGQHLAGHVRVHVHLDDLVVVDHDDTVAEILQERAQELRALAVLARDDKLRAVAERDLAGVELGEVRALFRCLRGSRSGGGHGGGGAALQIAEHGVHDEHEALAAGIDHACAAQHGVDVLRVGQRLARGGEQRIEHALKVRAVLGEGHGGLRAQTADGEDCALGRLHDGLVGGVHAGGDGGGKFRRARSLAALEGLGDPAEQQRQNDAGVAARTAQQRARGAVGHGADGVGLLAAELDGGRVHRQAHVRAGIAVRNREDVELVDLLFVFFQCRVCAQEHFPKRCGINDFSQICTPPTGGMKMARKRGSRVGSSAKCPRLIEEHGVHVHVHARHGDAGGLVDLVADLVDDAVGKRGNVHAVIDRDVQLERDAAVIGERGVDALGHGFAAQELERSAVFAAADHTFHAEATGRGVACKVGEYFIGDADGAIRLFDFDHVDSPFLNSSDILYNNR